MNYELRSLIEALNENGIHVIADRAFDKIEFDFSEHDKKVAEEKDALLEEMRKNFLEVGRKKDAQIAELEKENSALKEKLSFIRTRVTAEARDLFDCDMFGSLVVTVPKKSNAENKINLNDRIKFKLTPLGAEIYYHQYDEINKKAGRNIIEPHMPKIDKDGYTENTLWAFMELYGNHIGVGKRNVIDPINIFVL